MGNAKPIATYRGSLEEIISHTHDLPENAVLELRVFEPDESGRLTKITEDFDGPSAFEKYGHLFGRATGLPTDLAARAEDYLRDGTFGKTVDERKLD